jgi:hypothetical protein|tara:strand:+ start:975 stop:1451 length:477 start_codon:yes stop_codon:yes gene_type:complete|mmetsp:Transcript_5774/g.21830  ORF Transcript_5774/g.21830 Transcript_5774/m.21830 type:complete len:159 (-) Transcript_5774:879-1355(-)
MSKKNSKKRWNNQHQESMRREKMEADAKDAKAAKRDEKVLELVGEMAVDSSGSGARKATTTSSVKTKTRAGKPKVRDSQAPSAALKVGRAVLKKNTVGGKTKNTRKIIKNVRLGKGVQTRLKIRKGDTIRGIKVTDSDSRNKILASLKAEAAMAMVTG